MCKIATDHLEVHEMDAKKTGELIAMLRKEQNLNQSELADRLGVTNKAISRWETGRGYPDIETLPKLSEALCISIPELLEGERAQAADFEQEPSSMIHTDRDSVIESVCKYAGEQSRRQKRKYVLSAVLFWIAIGLGAIYFLITVAWPVVGGAIYSVVGSTDCVVAQDYRSLTYLGETYVPLPMNGYSGALGERMVDECRVEGTGFFGKLLFGDMLYEVKYVPNNEIVYLQTDYDLCISEYFVLESKYEYYTQMLQEADFSQYFFSQYAESGYRWERELSPVLANAIENLQYPAVSEEPDISYRLDVLLYDESHIFFYQPGTLLQTSDGYYWSPAEFPSHGYGMHPGCTWTEQYYPLMGFDHELNELFS